MLYKSIIRPILFSFDPEKVHHFVAKGLQLAFATPGISFCLRKAFEAPENKTEIAGLTFKNNVGLAAGFDKNAEMIDQMAALGFGFVEIGTITPKPQDGNEQPRLFRLPKDQALINRMGFNNRGVDAAVELLKKRKSDIIVGGNIGKNKTTPNEEAVSDYLICFEKLFDWVDYFTVNVSSPNTAGLRELQEKEPLTHLLDTLQSANKKRESPKPIFLKIAPDLTNQQLDDIVAIVNATGIAGVIATNTTIERANLRTLHAEVQAIGAGGLSGLPVREKSTEVLTYLANHPDRNFSLMAAGGVFTKADYHAKIQAGAAAVQVYTGFVYEGPGMVKKLLAG